MPNYTVIIGDEAYGTSEEVAFCQYQVRLLTDIGNTGITTDDDNTFIIIFAKAFENAYPVLDSEMVVICSIEAASGIHDGKYIFFDRSFYYIDGETSLAAYEGDDSPASKMCSKNLLIRQIKKIRGK